MRRQATARRGRSENERGNAFGIEETWQRPVEYFANVTRGVERTRDGKEWKSESHFAEFTVMPGTGPRHYSRQLFVVFS